MQNTRTSFQQGSIRREKRKNGPDVWTLRWREMKNDSTTRRKVVLGTVERLATKAAAWKACESLRMTINPGTSTPRTMAELVTHYKQKEMSEDGAKSFATRKAYGFYLDGWIVPKWGECSLSDIRTVAVEEWLKTVPLAPGSRAKIRNLMSTLFKSCDALRVDGRKPDALSAPVCKKTEHSRCPHR